ncbi:adaptin ear-binding coat-associated protein 1 NECAP-1 [Macrolepiota fuliginosa MF-IS2]|uniref:Adaptin ear-binding coat-associated protein 1 NECAP-1 n=1 Tax=Macrolepiota fuliginosa MF-IS2 TaxID=1400762 RepID=A0A9P5XRU1_9AGAR|nr:adaptin ear-binding coat-associated protein 1 NECAP-1 [Macrolepiota fuliginosa MF-IS2]
MDLDSEIESILYIGREVSVYKIPPLRANVGHRAGEWGDLADPLWKGRLRIIERSAGVVMQFEDSQTGELFAKADYDPERPSVEAVLDSSRYFVVRVEDSGRKAYIGMGFAERTDSFDFNVALQDYTKRYKAKLHTDTAEPGAPSPHLPIGPKKDYSLKEGQTFTINLPGRSGQTSSLNVSNSVSNSTGSSIPLLPPPPGGTKKR